MDNVELFPINEDSREGVEERPLFPDEKPLTPLSNLEEVAGQVALVEQSHATQQRSLKEHTTRAAYDIQTLGIGEVRRSLAEREKNTAVSAAEGFVRSPKEMSLEDAAAYYQSVLEFHNPPRKTAMEEAVVEIITPKSSAQYYNEYNMKEATKNLAARNIIYETLSSSDNATFWDEFFALGREFLGFVNPRTTNKAIAEALKKESKWTDSINPKSIVDEFRAVYVKSSPEKRRELVQALQHGLEKYSSFVGDKNAKVVADSMAKILQGTQAEFTETTILDVLNLPLITTANLLYRGLTTAAQLGRPAKVAQKVGRTDVAVDLMTKDAIGGTKASGMTADEIARAATSMNVAPLELTMDELKISQQLQESLRTYSASLRANVTDTLKATGMRPEEMSAAKDIVKEIYSNQRNKAIHEYIPESYENGLFKGIIKWQSQDGVPFQSREAAEIFGIENGKAGQVIEIGAPAVIQEVPKGITTPYKNYTEFLAAAKRAGSSKSEIAELTGIKSAKDFNDAKWKEKFESLETKVWGSEKTPSRPLTPEELKVWDGGRGWREFSKLRGYTKSEIADFQTHLEMTKEGIRRFGKEYVDGVSSDIQYKRDQWVFVEKVQEPVPLNAIGDYTLADVEGRNFFNAGIPFFSASRQTVNERGVGLAANAKIRRELEDKYREAVTGISGYERPQVNHVLAEGDAMSNAAGAVGHVFSAEELAAKGLSDKAVESYYKIRLMRDNMWLLRNAQMVEEFAADGVKELAFAGNAFVKPMNRPVKPLDAGSIKSLISNKKVGKVLDTRDGSVVDLAADEIDAIYQSGGQVVRLYKPEGIGRRKYTHLIVDNNESLVRDIHVALPFRPGEFSRIYTDEYMITLRRELMDEFDNPESHITETLRTARSSNEAKKFVTAYNEAKKVVLSEMLDNAKLVRVEQLVGKYIKPQDFIDEIKNRGLTDKDVFDFHYSRDTHSYLQDTVDEAINNGRLFYSHKGEKLLATDPSRVNTLNITDSLGVELANIARYITSKDIRVAAIERWMNTFGDGIANRTFNKWIDFDKGELDAGRIRDALVRRGSPLSESSSAQLLKFAESERTYLRQQLNIRTRDQKLNQDRFRKSIEWIEGKPGLRGKVLDWFGPALRNADVSDFIRRINFNISLGMGNPSQLMVQANGMFIGAAIHPIHGLNAAKTAIPLRMALMSDNPKVWSFYANVDSLTSLGLKNPQEFVDIVKSIRKSGILDDIRSTALYNVEDGALDLFKGYSTDAFNKVSPFFFNRGEEFSRLVSWEIARREWVKRNPSKLWTSNDALKEILVRQKEFNLGMQSHNIAMWQKGWLGIPFQFLQYNLKLATSLMHTTAQFRIHAGKAGWKEAITNFDGGNYRGFNPTEALKLLASQIVLYGAAGNGLRWIANEMWGDQDTGMSEEQKMYISEGLAGGLVYSLTKHMDEVMGKEADPAKLALGKRLGSFEWYQQIWDKITTDKTDVTDFLFGVTKSTGVKAYDTIKGLARVFIYSDELTPELILNELGKAPEVIASYSNALKAYTYMQNEGIVTSKYGTPIARLNAKENLAAFLGISSVEVSEYYQSVQDLNRLEQNLSELARHIKKLQVRQLEATLNGDEKLADELEKLRWALMPRDYGHRRIVDRIIGERLWPGDTQADALRRKFETELNLEQEKFRVLDKGR